jgi:hypothetical protein
MLLSVTETDVHTTFLLFPPSTVTEQWPKKAKIFYLSSSPMHLHIREVVQVRKRARR